MPVVCCVTVFLTSSSTSCLLYTSDDKKKAEAQLKDAEPQEKAAVKEIHDALEASVKRQLMSRCV